MEILEPVLIVMSVLKPLLGKKSSFEENFIFIHFHFSFFCGSRITDPSLTSCVPGHSFGMNWSLSLKLGDQEVDRELVSRSDSHHEVIVSVV